MNDPILAALLILGLSLVFMALGVWVALALMLSGLFGLWIFHGSIEIASNVFFDSTNSFTLTAVPLFILLGEILVRCGASESIYRGTSRLLSWAPGGLLHANMASCALFAAICGSSPATAATIGTVAIPALDKRGYDRRITLGSLAAGGTLGILIPPSINMIIYGMVANASVGQLFIGGVVPGILMTLAFMAYIAVRAVLNPAMAPREYDLSLSGAMRGLIELWPVWFLGIVVLGGIFLGIFTPTEAAAVGVAGALLIAAMMGQLTLRTLLEAMRNTVAISSMVLFVYVGAMVLSNFFGVMGVPQMAADRVLSAELGPYLVLAAVFLLYLFLGCFLDGISMMVLTVPTVLPILEALGFDRIWFGVVLVVLCEIGMITPPMGLNLFVIQGISGRPLYEVVAGVMPFFFLMLLCLGLLTVVPDLVLWLPRTLGTGI